MSNKKIIHLQHSLIGLMYWDKNICGNLLKYFVGIGKWPIPQHSRGARELPWQISLGSVRYSFGVHRGQSFHLFPYSIEVSNLPNIKESSFSVVPKSPNIVFQRFFLRKKTRKLNLEIFRWDLKVTKPTTFSRCQGT